MHSIANAKLIAFGQDLRRVIRHNSQDGFQCVIDTMFWYVPNTLYDEWEKAFGISSMTLQGWENNTSPISNVLMKRIALWWIDRVEIELKLRKLTE